MSAAVKQALQIVDADGSWLIDSCGGRYLDLCMGYGSVWLGHKNPAVNTALQAQLNRYAAPGFLRTAAVDSIAAEWAPWLPNSHYLAGIYSTGMEAMEVAIRVAWAHSNRRDIVGFRHSTHGRSYLTAAIGGGDEIEKPPFVHTLPGFCETNLGQQIKAFREVLGRVHPATIVVEPVQMTGGGFELPQELAMEIAEMSAARSIPLLFDESLTGMYRCGRRFWFEGMPTTPDIVVIGKGMANGFPCAGLVLRREITWSRESVKPGSTFWNHPLACAAARATLRELASLDVLQRVGQIQSLIVGALGDLALRGQGALWSLAVPDPSKMDAFVACMQNEGVIVSYYGGNIRLLPALTIAPEFLSQACKSIRKAHAATFG